MDRRTFLTGAVATAAALTTGMPAAAPAPEVMLDVGASDATWVAVCQMDTSGVWRTLATHEVVGDVDEYMDRFRAAAMAG